MMIVYGLLLSLISVWISAAKDPSGGPSSVEFPTKLRSYAQSEPQVSLDVNPLDARRRRNTCRRELKGKCVRRNRRCPHSLPSEKSPGKPYCSRRKRCCYLEDTFCKFNSTQERNEFVRLWPGRCPGEEGVQCKWPWVTDGSSTFTNHPLILDSTTKSFVLPEGIAPKTNIIVPSGSQLIFACPNTLLTKYKKNSKIGICENGDLKIDGSKVKWEDMECDKRITSSTTKSFVTGTKTQKKCGQNKAGLEWLIAFQVGNEFYTLIEVCFENDEETTLWTKNTIRGKSISARVGKKDRDWTAKADLFTTDMDKIYKVSNQITFFEQADVLGKNIIEENNEKFFAHGHLTPRSDFITRAEQDATYKYINCVPQWQQYNGGNWQKIEEQIQDLAKTKIPPAQLKVITGGAQLAKLYNHAGKEKEIYLGYTTAKPKKVPIPGYMWKLVYEERGTEKYGVVFVTVNNQGPSVGLHPPYPCKTNPSDVCGKLTWLNIDTGSKNLGETYCCEIGDLDPALFPNVPNIDQVKGLIQETYPNPSPV